MVAVVGVGAVQKIAVEKDRRARVELEMDQLQPLDRGVHTFRVSLRLAIDAPVIDQADCLRPGQHLEAAILLVAGLTAIMQLAMKGNRQCPLCCQ